MKRIISIVLILLMLTGCANIESVSEDPVDVSRFMMVEKCVPWEIVVDRETKVMYAVSIGQYNRGTFTLLVDADGKPLLWEGEDDETDRR